MHTHNFQSDIVQKLKWNVDSFNFINEYRAKLENFVEWENYFKKTLGLKNYYIYIHDI